MGGKGSCLSTGDEGDLDLIPNCLHDGDKWRSLGRLYADFRFCSNFDVGVTAQEEGQNGLEGDDGSLEINEYLGLFKILEIRDMDWHI